jgi:hypothetical protein
MDDPTPQLDPPEGHRLAVCREHAAYGFTRRVSRCTRRGVVLRAHRQEGERTWAARYRGILARATMLL